MAEQNTEAVPEHKDTEATAATDVTAAEDDDAIDDLEFLIDDIEDQIAPLGL